MSAPEPFDPIPTNDLDSAETKVAMAMERLRRSLEPLGRVGPDLARRAFALHASLGAVLDELRDRR